MVDCFFGGVFYRYYVEVYCVGGDFVEYFVDCCYWCVDYCVVEMFECCGLGKGVFGFEIGYFQWLFECQVG